MKNNTPLLQSYNYLWKHFIQKTSFLPPAITIALILIHVLNCNNTTKQKEAQIRGDYYSECLSGEITVYGEAPVFTSVTAATEKAKEDACRRAIEKCIGSQVASYTQVADAQSITNEIYSQSTGICRNDQVIEKQEYFLDTIRMMRLFVKFRVDRISVENHIQLMQKLIGNPKILVLLREEIMLPGMPKKVHDFHSRDSIGGSLLRNILIEKGYDVLDSSLVASYTSNSEIISHNPDKIPEVLLDKSLQIGADILIIGYLETFPQELSASQFKSYQTTGNITLLSLWGQGETIGTFSGRTVGGVGITDLQAAQESIKRFVAGSNPDPEKRPGGFAKFALEKLQTRWAEITKNNKILMRITGLEVEKAGIFRDDLIERTSVKKINEISSSQNEILWEVIYPGREFALRDTLSFYGDNPKIFSIIKETQKKIKILDVRKGTIHIQFQ